MQKARARPGSNDYLDSCLRCLNGSDTEQYDKPRVTNKITMQKQRGNDGVVVSTATGLHESRVVEDTREFFDLMSTNESVDTDGM